MPKFRLIAGEDPMRSLCRLVISTNYEDLPSNVVDYCKKAILDTMAVTIGGSAMEGIPAVVELVKDKGGKPESIIPFYGGKVPASEAGLVIAPMTRAMDFGDVHSEASHTSEYVFPALLAATGLKDKVAGKEFITSFAVGSEVLVRIGTAIKALTKGAPVGGGDGHYIFGCVAAVGKLLDLSLEELEHAMGIARAMTQPLDAEMYCCNTLMVRVHHGFVCQDAINACLLAKRGITAAHPNMLLGPTGYLGFAKWETDPDALTRELGEKWEMLDIMMKPYASCKCTHTSIYGVLDQMKEHNFKVEDIANIDFDEATINWVTVCDPQEVKWNPQTVPDCQFSLPYVVAIAALGEGVSIGAYTPEARARQDVRDLMTKISAKEDPSLPIFAARVHITLKDGRKYSREYIYVKGHPKNPFTVEELIDKLRQCVTYSAYKLGDSVVNSLIDAILNLEKVDNVVNALIIPLAPEQP
jgi:2-methylcitrate dehydratase PrpD